jgi:hypothetical protein
MIFRTIINPGKRIAVKGGKTKDRILDLVPLFHYYENGNKKTNFKLYLIHINGKQYQWHRNGVQFEKNIFDEIKKRALKSINQYWDQNSNNKSIVMENEALLENYSEGR